MKLERVDVAVVATTQFSGGAEKYIANLYSALSARGYRVGLIGNLRPWKPQIGTAVDIRSGPKWSLRTLLPGISRAHRETARLRTAVSEELSANIFHLHFKREQISFTRFLSTQGIVVWTEHGRFPTGPFGFIIKPLYRHAARRAALIICVSDYVRDQVVSIVAGACPVRTIPSAVDTQLFTPPSRVSRTEIRRKYGLSEGKPIAVFVGRVDAGKRPRLAILAGLAAHAHMVVAGEGSELERLKTEFANAEVTFAGRIESIWEIYALADVHVFASDGRGEGFPTVLLESAATGIPTVAVDDCGFATEVISAGGVIAEPTTSEVAKAIVKVLDGPWEMSTAKARNWALQRDYSRLVTEYTRAFGLQDR